MGEKARVLEARGRTDVIAAVGRHEIGYHTNLHSIQPTPAVYMAPLGWAEGVAEFDRRERLGFDDVARIFGQKPTCYGQPGNSWGVQSYGALKNWGVGVYLDVGSHVGLDDKPFYYCGLLSLFRLAATTRCELGGPADLDAAQKRFFDIRESLRTEGGGFVSIYYHPCELVQTEFWDAANFRHGANPPRDQWKLPGRKTPEAQQVAWETFTSYVRFIRRFADVEFVTATDAARLYGDRARGRPFDKPELRAIAAAVSPEVTFQQHGDYTLSAAEVLTLLNGYVVLRTSGQQVESISARLKPTGSGQSAGRARRTGDDRLESIHAHGRRRRRLSAPSRRGAAGRVARQHGRSGRGLFGGVGPSRRGFARRQAGAQRVEIRPARLAAARYVSDDNPNLWNWPIFPDGFRASRDDGAGQASGLDDQACPAGVRGSPVSESLESAIRENAEKPAVDAAGFHVGP